MWTLWIKISKPSLPNLRPIDDLPDRGDGNSERSGFSDSESMDRDEGVEAFIWAPCTSTSLPTASHHNRHRVVLAGEPMKRGSGVIPSSDLPRAPPLPLNDETPTRPRIRTTDNRRR
jgi:F-box and WD-40 domain protein CDC4